MAHISVELPKSTRERYILVAAMDIVISDVTINICIAGTHKNNQYPS